MLHEQNLRGALSCQHVDALHKHMLPKIGHADPPTLLPFLCTDSRRDHHHPVVMHRRFLRASKTAPELMHLGSAACGMYPDSIFDKGVLKRFFFAVDFLRYLAVPDDRHTTAGTLIIAFVNSEQVLHLYTNKGLDVKHAQLVRQRPQSQQEEQRQGVQAV